MQIRSRLTLQFIFIVASILFFSLSSIYYFSKVHRENEFYHVLKKKAITTADLLLKVHEVDSSLLKIIDKSKKDVLLLENISIYNEWNVEIYTNNDSIDFSRLVNEFDRNLIRIRESGEIKISAEPMDILGVSYISRQKKYVVLAGAVDSFGLESLNNLKKILFTVFVITLVAAGMAGWLYAGKALRPISSLVDYVDKITENNLNTRLHEGNRKDEIARLSFTFNKMLDRIESAFKVQKTFVANASHELRNPLTKITSQLEVALLNDREKEEYKKTISSVLEDIKNLNEISYRLLQLAKISSLEADTRFTSVRMDDLIWETKMEFLAGRPDSTVNFFLDKLPDSEQELTIMGNTPLLKICFVNLIDNACKFSNSRSATIKLSSGRKKIIIQVIDHGKGIDKNDLPYIFEPFYRSKNSVLVAGHGIGLSLVDKIVRLHYGRISVLSEVNTGSTFTLTFPLSNSNKNLTFV